MSPTKKAPGMTPLLQKADIKRPLLLAAALLLTTTAIPAQAMQTGPAGTVGVDLQGIDRAGEAGAEAVFGARGARPDLVSLSSRVQ